MERYTLLSFFSALHKASLLYFITVNAINLVSKMFREIGPS